MINGTIEQIRRFIQTKQYKIYGNQQLAEKAYKFIVNLQKSGVPLKNIDVTDWSSAPVKVYVYSRKDWWTHKIYQRFSNYDLQNAVRFYRGGK
jgi:hypothetical protein